MYNLGAILDSVDKQGLGLAAGVTKPLTDWANFCCQILQILRENSATKNTFSRVRWCLPTWHLPACFYPSWTLPRIIWIFDTSPHVQLPA